MKNNIIGTQFEAAMKNAYASSETPLSAIKAVESQHDSPDAIKDELMADLVAYDQSTQATQSTNPVVVDQKELLFANWFQSGFDAAYEYLSA